jgi:uncharacterized damage-inducible protein DinB
MRPLDLRALQRKGMISCCRFDSPMMGFFMHKVHYRGQASTLLAQSGMAIGPAESRGLSSISKAEFRVSHECQ